ncbi:CAP family protein [Croceicoccus bisphenolivorans]|uniref:CAP family protein n=1 Tax=Croceicoccus bisphenolivorans TaxID=1783232 RepID=UPI0009EEBDBF|nr:CAP family protein [Croceicoccus bisphenolivorans]
MGRVRFLALGITGAIAAVATIGLGGIASSQERGWVERVGAGSFAERLLEAHNSERRRMGVPELRWSPKLAAQAQAYARKLSKGNSLVHASNAERGGAGENLWAGRAGFYTAEEMIEGMIDEKRHFTKGDFPKVSRTGQWRDVGHYTQLIWRDTTEMGCAVVPGGGNDWLVCRYWPAGNIYGKPVF